MIISMFLLVAFGVPLCHALASAVKPIREVFSVASGCLAWLLDAECVDALLILFATKMEI